MSTIFLILFLVSVLLLIVGLIKPTKVKRTSRKKVFLLYGTLSLVFLIVGAVSSVKPEPQAITQSTPVQQQTLEDRIKALVENTFSTKVLYVGIQIDEDKTDLPNGAPVGSKLVTINLNVTSLYNKDSLMSDTGKLSGQIFQEVFASNPNAYNVTVAYASDLTDKYGQTKNGPLLTHSIDKATYQKINWQNFDSTTMCDFLRSENKDLSNGDICAIDVKSLQ